MVLILRLVISRSLREQANAYIRKDLLICVVSLLRGENVPAFSLEMTVPIDNLERAKQQIVKLLAGGCEL